MNERRLLNRILVELMLLNHILSSQEPTKIDLGSLRNMLAVALNANSASLNT